LSRHLPRASFSAIGRGTNLSYTSSIYQFDKSQTNFIRPIDYTPHRADRIYGIPTASRKKYTIEQLLMVDGFFYSMTVKQKLLYLNYYFESDQTQENKNNDNK